MHVIRFFMILPLAFCLRSNSLLVLVSLRIVRIAIARMAVPKPISDVLRELEDRYEGASALTKVLLDNKGVNVRKPSDFTSAFAHEKGPSVNTIVQVVGFVDLSAGGQVSKLRQATIALKKTEAHTESLQRKVVDEIDFDQPLDCVVLSKLGDSFYERCWLTPVTLLRGVGGADAAQYVLVPFDIVLAYHFRVLAAAQIGTRHLGRTIP